MSELVNAPSEGDVMEALANVIDPELGLDFVELGLIYGVEIDDGNIHVTFTLTTPGCPIRSHFEQAVAQNVSQLEGVTEVGVGFDVEQSHPGHGGHGLADPVDLGAIATFREIGNAFDQA